MKPKKLLPLFLLLLSMLVPAASSQVFWSNYSPPGVTDAIWCVANANGTFEAVTDQGNLLSSRNGLTWSTQSIDLGVWLLSVAYGNGTWVVVGDKGTILTSADLKTWVHAATVTSNKLNGVYYTGSIWVAVGDSGTILTSSDARTWLLQPAPAGVTGFLHGITSTVPNASGFGGGIWICGQGGVVLNGSGSGTDASTYGFTTYAAGPLVITSVSGGLSYTNVPFTQNLEVIVAAPPLAPKLGEQLFGGGQGLLFFAGISLEPYDLGMQFGPSLSPTPNVDFRGMAYGNGYWVAAGEQGTIYRSTDGANWVQSFAGDSPSSLSTATLFSAAYSPTLQRFVVTGAGGTILVSDSSPTVLANVSTRGYVAPNQPFIGGFVITGTAARTVLVRADGPVLAAFNVSDPLADPVLTVYDSAGNVVATNTGWTSNSSPSQLSAAAQATGAFALPDPGRDSALLLTLQPGAYTALVSSAGGNSGAALFEAYTE